MTGSEDISHHLKALRAKSGLTVRNLAGRLGMPHNTYANWEQASRKKKQFLPMEFAHRLADAYAGTPVTRAEIMALAGVSDPVPAVQPALQIPVYNVSASAGNGTVVENEDVVDRLTFPAGYLHSITKTSPRHLAIISVKGNSMVPTLSHEDVVMLDMTKTNAGFDGLFVLEIDGVLHIKRISRSSEPGWVSIISDNRTEYPTFLRRVEDVRIVGKVVWKGQRL